MIFIRSLAVAMMVLTALPATAATLALSPGRCLIYFERNECGMLIVRDNMSLGYLAGICEDGNLSHINYRAQSVRVNGDTVTIDREYHIQVLEAQGRTFNIRYYYTDDLGEEHSGSKRFTCR